MALQTAAAKNDLALEQSQSARVPLRVLHLEDSVIDAELVSEELRRDGLLATTLRVETETDFRRQLGEYGPDIILADYSLPRYDGRSALTLARQVTPDVPFVFVSGAMGEETAVEALQHGAKDFVLKQHLWRLGSAVRRALQELREHRDRKLAEESLRESEERLQLVLEGSQLGFWDWNLETGRLLRNERWAEMIGYTVADIEATVPQWTDLIHAADRAAVWKSIQDHLEGRSPMHDCEYRMRAKDGHYRWLQDRGRIAKRDPQGRPVRMCGTRTDITERKQAEESLDKARDAAETANRAKSAFLATMSHELRTPLTAVIGFSAGLLERADEHPLDRYQRDRLTRIKDSGEHLLALINEVLDIAKIEAGKMPLYISSFDVGAVAREVSNLAEGLLRLKPDVQYHLDLESGLPRVASDQKVVRQILINLVGNAVKFTERGRITLCVRREGDDLLLSVEDTGIGIPQEHLARVFEKFYQVTPAARPSVHGTGLGLSLSKAFADLLGGKLTVHSTGGQGSTFTLLLPRNFAAREPPLAEPHAVPLPFARLTEEGGIR